MAEPIPLKFGEEPVTSRSFRARSANCVNFIKEVSDGMTVLYGRPGYVKVLTFPNNPENRAMLVANNKLYAVMGNKFYEVSDGLVYTERGTLNSNTGRAKMEFDGFHITIVDGVGMYRYRIQHRIFKEVKDAILPYGPTQLVFNDGFHYVGVPNTARFVTHVIPFEPGDRWEDEATAEYDGDNLIALEKESAYVYLIGQNSTEIWESNPDGQFPLRPNRNAYMEYGCAAEGTPIQIANGLQWLAREEQGGYLALRTESGRPKRISTHELENEWSKYSTVEDAHSQLWNVDGHVLWLLTFPTAKKTWVYDMSINLPEGQRWSEFQSYADNPTNIAQFQGVNSVFLKTCHMGDIIIMGDKDNTGNLYRVSFDDLSDDGRTIHSYATSQEVKTLDNAYVDHSDLELFLETGVEGSTSSTGPYFEPFYFQASGDRYVDIDYEVPDYVETPPGGGMYFLDFEVTGINDTNIRVKYSDDHGNTWVNKRWVSFGKSGEYKKRIRYRGLGRSRHRYYQVHITDSVKKALVFGVLRREGADYTEPQEIKSVGA